MNKISKNTILFSCTLIILLGVGFFYSSQQNKVVQEKQIVDSRTQADKLLDENCSCGTGVECSNAKYSSCVSDVLNKTVTEREWKYNKLENIQDPQVSAVNFFRPIDSFRTDLKSWHQNLVTSRDQWCNASLATWSDNGIPTELDQCRLEIELRAISLLDNLYYKGIMQDTPNSKGISDFEVKTSLKKN